MATVSTPLSHDVSNAGFQDAGWRPDYVLEGTMRERLMDSVTLRNSGFVPLVGDVAGMSSPTIRMKFLDAIGFGLSMSSLSEAASITASNLTATYEEVTVGRYGIGWDNTYLNQILAPSGELTMEGLAIYNQYSYDSTWMDALATVIQTAATDSGRSGVAAEVDDLLDAIYFFDGLDSQVPLIIGVIHNIQKIHLKESFRLEPAFQFPEVAEQILSTQGGPGFWRLMFNAATYVSTHVAASGGNRHGAFFAPGAVVWAIGSTSSVRPAVEANTVRLDDMGLITEFSGTPGSATSTIRTNAFFGMDGGDGEIIRGFVTAQS